MVKKFGTREEVCDGKASMTKGGLTAADFNIVVNKKGERKFVSKKASELSKARNFNRQPQEPAEPTESAEPVESVQKVAEPPAAPEAKRRGRPSKASTPVKSPKHISPSILDNCSDHESSDYDNSNMSRVYPPAETKKRVKKAVIASAKEVAQLAA